MNYTRYMHIIPGIYQLTVYRRINPGFAIVNTNIRLRSGYSYTLAVLGTFNDFRYRCSTPDRFYLRKASSRECKSREAFLFHRT